MLRTSRKCVKSIQSNGAYRDVPEVTAAQPGNLVAIRICDRYLSGTLKIVNKAISLVGGSLNESLERLEVCWQIIRWRCVGKGASLNLNYQQVIVKY